MQQISKLLLIPLFLISFFNSKSQDEGNLSFGDEEESVPEYYFGFSLVETSYGSYVHYALIPSNKTVNRVRYITADDFFSQASGQTKSLANPKKINFFNKYNIKHPLNSVFDLWKLRFKEVPHGRSQDRGWANYNEKYPSMFILSKPQMDILKKYGINNIRDFIKGENAFKLLKNIGDSIWVQQYIMAGGSSPAESKPK